MGIQISVSLYQYNKLIEFNYSQRKNYGDLSF